MVIDLYKSNTELLSAIKEKRFLTRLLTNNVVINAKSGSVYYDVFKKQFSPFSIMYAYNGDEYYEMDGVTLKAAPGNIIIIPPGKPYSSFIESENEVHCLSLYFSEKLVNDLFNPSIFFDDISQSNLFDLINQKKIFQLDQATRNLLFRFDQAIHSNPNPDELVLLMSELVLKTFDEYQRIWEKTVSYDAKKLPTKIELGRRMFLLKDYIYCNYQKEIDIKELAGISFLNHYYLIRKFKSFFGITPYQMLIKRRLEVARDQIQNTSKPVAEVISNVGYSNSPNFYSSFRKEYGVNPNEIRF